MANAGFAATERRWVEIAIDGTSGGIDGVTADLIPKRPELDECIAATLTDVCFNSFVPVRDSYNSMLRTMSFRIDPLEAPPAND